MPAKKKAVVQHFFDMSIREAAALISQGRRFLWWLTREASP